MRFIASQLLFECIFPHLAAVVFARYFNYSMTVSRTNELIMVELIGRIVPDQRGDSPQSSFGDGEAN